MKLANDVRWVRFVCHNPDAPGDWRYDVTMFGTEDAAHLATRAMHRVPNIQRGRLPAFYANALAYAELKRAWEVERGEEMPVMFRGFPVREAPDGMFPGARW